MSITTEQLAEARAEIAREQADATDAEARRRLQAKADRERVAERERQAAVTRARKQAARSQHAEKFLALYRQLHEQRVAMLEQMGVAVAEVTAMDALSGELGDVSVVRWVEQALQAIREDTIFDWSDLRLHLGSPGKPGNVAGFVRATTKGT